MSTLARDLQREAAARARAEAIVEQREERLRELRAERDRLAAEVERLGRSWRLPCRRGRGSGSRDGPSTASPQDPR